MNRGSGEARPISIGEPDKVTAWPFKEPEKKSAWKEEAFTPKDVPIHMVDHELEKAKRRTEELKTMMSPPGALKLPDLLEAARLKWGIPDGAFKCQAIFDRIHVFPIDDEWNKSTYGNSSIQLTDTQKKRELQNGHLGILISMGMLAADQCVSHGIELGHIVETIRNAPHAQQCALLVEGGAMHYLIMRAGDLTGSRTQRELLLKGETRIVDEGGDHGYCYNIEGKKKRVPLVKDNW
jgi:hypothetical protein